MLDEGEVLSDWHPNETLSSQTVVAMTHVFFMCCLVCLWVVVLDRLRDVDHDQMPTVIAAATQAQLNACESSLERG